MQLHRTAQARRLSARRLPARSQPRTVPAGRPTSRAITRCAAPSAARRSASPITSAPSRLRGTSHEGESTCVASHGAHRARRGLTDRVSCSSRTSRERANPHGESAPEQAGHANSPAASAASTRSGVIAIESIEDRQLAHSQRTLPDAVTAGKGRVVLHVYHSARQRERPATGPPLGAVPTVNGANGSFRAEIQRRPTKRVDSRSSCALVAAGLTGPSPRAPVRAPKRSGARFAFVNENNGGPLAAARPTPGVEFDG
jgi:hypothetical protein